MKHTWHVHVFRLTAHADETLWVGVSYSPPAGWLRSDLSDYRHLREVRDARPEPAQEFCEHLDPFARRYDAERAADSVAAELRAAGYTVLARPGR